MNRSFIPLSFLVLLAGCKSPPPPDIIVYAALDREFSEPILKKFEEETGLKVAVKYDVESTKTVGLVNAIMQESNRPRCDLFWNNEALHTLRLQEKGLLAPVRSAQGEQFPPQYKAQDGSWYGLAARARVLIVNTELVSQEETPQSVLDLADPRWQGRVAIAKPLFGTTATHAAVLFDVWGDEQAKEFFRAVKQNVQVLSGNKQVAQAVAAGQVDFGITDTDDALIEMQKGHPVMIVYPDQGEEEMGTLLIPNTVALIAGGPHPQAARRLLEYLLSPEVEIALAKGPSSQFPLNPRVSERPLVATLQEIKQLPVDFPAAAGKWEEASRFLEELFTSG